MDGGLTDDVVIVEHEHCPAGGLVRLGIDDLVDDARQGQLGVERPGGVTLLGFVTPAR